MLHHNDKVTGVMTVHIDGVLWAGSDLFDQSVISKLAEILPAGIGENFDFQYLGLNIQSETFHFAIDQNNCTEQLKKVDIDPVGKFQKGHLIWISNHTWPDISRDVLQAQG